MPALPAPISYPIRDPKLPEARLDYRHSFTAALLVDGVDVGDTIIPVSDADPTKRPSVTVFKGDAVVDTLALDTAAGKNDVVYWVSGGTKDTIFLVTVRTAQGRKLAVHTILKIKTS